MKNIPNKIYLQIGEDCDSDDFKELTEVTWCEDSIDSNDIQYMRLTNKAKEAFAEIASKTDYPRSSIGIAFGRIRNICDELGIKYKTKPSS